MRCVNESFFFSHFLQLSSFFLHRDHSDKKSLKSLFSVSNLVPQKLDLVAIVSIYLPFSSWDFLVPELVAGKAFSSHLVPGELLLIF